QIDLPNCYVTKSHQQVPVYFINSYSLLGQSLTCKIVPAVVVHFPLSVEPRHLPTRVLPLGWLIALRPLESFCCFPRAGLLTDQSTEGRPYRGFHFLSLF